MCGRSSHKVFDPELDDMIKDIEDYMKNNGFEDIRDMIGIVK